LEDRFDLIAAAIDHGVPFPGKLSPEEESQVDEFTKVLRSFAAERRLLPLGDLSVDNDFERYRPHPHLERPI
jgi:hypothetical protein